MSTTTTCFLEPLDVLFLRGNKLFGDPGSFGESLVPPWPSVAAGAIRSRMLADAKIDLAAFARGECEHPELGRLDAPGSFAVSAFHLARKTQNGIEILIQPPADLVITEAEEGRLSVRYLKPRVVAKYGVLSSAPLPELPVLAESERSKPASGYWLSEAGWRAYLKGEIPQTADLVKSDDLWLLDHRVGVGLEFATRRAAEGRLFSAQAVALKPNVGFLVAVCGANPPQEGLVRFGGDGRAAAVHAVEKTLPEPDYEAIAKARRGRLVLTAPGIFTTGWLPNGADPQKPREDGAIRFDLCGVTGWIVSAAVPRFEVVSGWDLARWQPKSAHRAAPTGSVYWLELDEGVTPEALDKLAKRGLWGEPCEDDARRAEGFNRFTWGVWP